MTKRSTKRRPAQKSRRLWVLVALGLVAAYGATRWWSKQRLQPLPLLRPSSQQKTQETPQEISEWTFEKAEPFLPQQAYPDNYSVVSLAPGSDALLVYATIIAGKQVGPQGSTGTLPGLRWLHWNQNKYDTQDVDFSILRNNLPDLGQSRLTGLPQVQTKPIIQAAERVYLAKIFLENDTRIANAFFVVRANKIEWAPLTRQDKTQGVAAWLEGTTRDKTRKLKVVYDPKTYLVVEEGVLELPQGYRWTVEAFFWDGARFVYDKDYSLQLTRDKQRESQVES